MNRREIIKLEADVRAVLLSKRPLGASALIQWIHQVNPTGKDLDYKTELLFYDLKSQLQSTIIRQFSENLEVRQEANADPDFFLLWHRPLGRDVCHFSIRGLDEDAQAWAQRFLDDLEFEKSQKKRPDPANKTGKTGLKRGMNANTGKDGGKGTNHGISTGTNLFSVGSHPKVIPLEKGLPLVTNLPIANGLSLATSLPASTTATSPTALPDRQVVGQLLNLGRVAIHEYEYDRALELLSQAFKLSGGIAEVALPLLDFLVDTMGSYVQALDLELLLAANAKRDPKVCIALARAAISLGEIERAEKFLAGVDDPFSAGLYLKMASEMVLRGLEESAENYLKLARAISTTGEVPGAIEVYAQIIALKDKRWKSVETELLQAMEAGNEVRAKALLQDLLLDHPTSVTGRLVREEFEQRQKKGLQEKLVRDAKQARAAADRNLETTALVELSALVGHGSKAAEEYRGRLAEIKREDNQAILRNAEDRLIGLLATDVDSALTYFFTLDFSLQEELAKRNEDPLISLAKAMRIHDTALKVKPVVESIIQFSCVNEASCSGADYDPLALQDRLNSLGQLLSGLPDFRKLKLRLDLEAREKRRALALKNLHSGRKFLADQNLPEALNCLKGPYGTNDLSGIDQVHWQELNKLVLVAMERKDLAARFVHAVEQEQFFYGRKIAESLVNMAQDEMVKQNWRHESRLLTAKINNHWHVHTYSNSPPLDFFEQICIGALHNNRISSLAKDGKTLALIESWGQWLFIVLMDPESNSAIETCVLKVPQVLRVETYFYDGDHICIYGQLGRVLKIRRFPNWWIESFSTFASDLLSDRNIEETFGDPYGNCVWIETRKRHSVSNEWEDEFLILDVEREKIIRSRRDFIISTLLLDNQDTRFGISKFPRGHLEIQSARGKTEFLFEIGPEQVVQQIVVHPTNKDLVVAHFQDEPTPEDQFEPAVQLTIASESGLGRPTLLKNSDGQNNNLWVTSSKSHGLIHAFYQTNDMSHELAALLPTEDGFDVLWTVPACRGDLSFVSVDNQHAVFMNKTKKGISLFRLTDTKPNHPVAEHCPWEIQTESFPSFSFDFLLCERIASRQHPQVEKLSVILRDMSLAALKEWIEHKKAERPTDPDSKFLVYLSLRGQPMAHKHDLDEIFLQWMSVRFPKDPTVLYELANRSLRKKDFPRARTHLETIELDAYSEETREHVCHMLGATQYMAGEFDSAYVTWENGTKCSNFIEEYKDHHSSCKNHQYLDLQKFSKKSQSLSESEIENKIHSRHFIDYLEVIFACDNLVSEGKYRTAWNILNRRGLPKDFTAQLDARFVHCLLKIHEGNEGYLDTNEKATLKLESLYYFARFCGAFAKVHLGDPSERKPIIPLPLPFESWSNEFLVQVFEQSKLFLDELKG